MGVISDQPDVYASPADAPRAVYVHVPFCLHRCGYCDFTLVARRDDLIPAYLAALENELSTVSECYEIDSLFIGGGTPTHLTAEQLQHLIQLIRRRFHLTESAEFSIEANPDGLDDDRLKTLADAGVNRLSLGIQSFDDDVLKMLERQHTAAVAGDVTERAVRYISNVSADLIFGVPGQSDESWKQTLTTAVQLPLSHISTYGLTYEKGTDFYSRRHHGTLSPLSDETERTMYAQAVSDLQAAGFRHYEISNFTRPASECRHNMVYWQADEYFAFGPGAARYVGGIRSTNARSVTRWIRSWQNNKPALQDYETLNPENKAREAVFLGLRLVDGLPLTSFQNRFSVSIEDLAGEALKKNVDNGFVEIVDNHLRLTAEGRFIADTVVADFL